MTRRLGLGSLIGLLVTRPGLWVEAIRALVSVRRRRRPWPSMAYVGWRSYTAYGEVTRLEPHDLVAFLEWRRHMRSMR